MNQFVFEDSLQGFEPIPALEAGYGDWPLDIVKRLEQESRGESNLVVSVFRAIVTGETSCCAADPGHSS